MKSSIGILIIDSIIFPSENYRLILTMLLWNLLAIKTCATFCEWNICLRVIAFISCCLSHLFVAHRVYSPFVGRHLTDFFKIETLYFLTTSGLKVLRCKQLPRKFFCVEYTGFHGNTFCIFKFPLSRLCTIYKVFFHLTFCVFIFFIQLLKIVLVLIFIIQ
jgi:hypothetical protein